MGERNGKPLAVRIRIIDQELEHLEHYLLQLFGE